MNSALEREVEEGIEREAARTADQIVEAETEAQVEKTFTQETAATIEHTAAAEVTPVVSNVARGQVKAKQSMIAKFGQGVYNAGGAIRRNAPDGYQVLTYTGSAGVGVGIYYGIEQTNRFLRFEDNVAQRAGDAADTIADGFTNAASTLGQGFAGIGSGINSAVAAILKAFNGKKDEAEQAAANFGPEASNVLREVGDEFRHMREGLKELAEGARNSLPNFSDITDVSQSLRNGAHDITGSITGAQTSLVTIGVVLVSAVVLFEGYRFVSRPMTLSLST